ncbi:prephenate dehydratase [Marvinbryantia sp.]|uniref:prephenate dehydratase n=1 Tax=Marvinbryantia sp. TaxID=2496532 RepID=UPI0025E5598F|nr:prephenate dehydratase [uncultured Marvinbryantia sp.]
MTELSVLRGELDVIDKQIVELYEKRMAVCEKVAEYKIQTGKKVFDKEREDAKIAALTALTDSDFNSHAIEELFRQIMSISRKRQYQLLAREGVIGRLPFTQVESIEKENIRVVFQGVEGAYTQAAMKKYFGDKVNSFAVAKWRDALEAISEGMADFAVLPIENSTAGFVSEIYDLLLKYDDYIVGEQIIRIEHTLLGLPGTKLSDIKTVCSHEQGLMQCEEFLNEHRDWQQVAVDNTAMAAKKVAKEQDASQAAIASAFAGEVFGLEVLKEHISTTKGNSTRFIIVSNQRIFEKDANKISICFETPHRSGALYHILSHFIYNNLNMSKIESRPIPERNWEYRFFVDVEGNLNDSAVKNALRGITEEAANVKILGNYCGGKI